MVNKWKFYLLSIVFLQTLIFPMVYATSLASDDAKIIISSPYQVKPGGSLKIFVSIANDDGSIDLQNNICTPTSSSTRGESYNN
jgi:hypothetical protein